MFLVLMNVRYMSCVIHVVRVRAWRDGGGGGGVGGAGRAGREEEA